jgi:hypothetical protein
MRFLRDGFAAAGRLSSGEHSKRDGMELALKLSRTEGGLRITRRYFNNSGGYFFQI